MPCPHLTITYRDRIVGFDHVGQYVYHAPERVCDRCGEVLNAGYKFTASEMPYTGVVHDEPPEGSPCHHYNVEWYDVGTKAICTDCGTELPVPGTRLELV